MTDPAAAPAASDTAPAADPDASAGVCQARIVTGSARLQVLVNGQWWDVDGISEAQVFTSDPRFAARISFSKISTISSAAAGADPNTAPRFQRPRMHARSTAPVQTTQTGTVERPAPKPAA
jgi:hypothetical protein